MWLLDSVLAGFPPTYPIARYDLFRALVVVAIGWKFAVEHRSGAWNFFGPESHIRYRYRLVAGPQAWLTQRRYRVAYVLKFVALVALAAGLAPRIAAALLAAWFFLESRYDLKFHTIYLGLCSGCLAFVAGSPARPAGVTFLTGGGGSTSAAGAFVIVAITVQMYWSSAYYKLRSPQFLSGLGLDQFTTHITNSSPQMELPEVWYRRPLRWIHRQTSILQRRRLWAAAAWLAVAVEIVLPVGLLAGPTWAAAAVLGVLLHTAFAALLPLRLVPFSLATCATFVLMRPL
jgi:hypothetical protein